MVVDSPDPTPAIAEPFEHDSRPAGRSPARRSGAVLESVPERAVAARRFRARCRGPSPAGGGNPLAQKLTGTPVLGAVLLDLDVGHDELRARLLSTAPEAQLREDQSDLAKLDAGRPERPASSRPPSRTPG